MPLRNCVCFGGLPRLALESLLLVLFGLAMVAYPATFVLQLIKTEFGLGMDRLQAALSLEAADSSVHVVRINLDAVPAVGRSVRLR